MDLQKSFTKVFAWMFLGLLLTFGTGYTVANNLQLLEMVYTKSTMFILIIIEVGLAIFLSARVHKMNPTLAKIIYVLYTILSGLTFSSIFITYKNSSIIYIFGITAGIFGLFALLGYVTKMDLTKIGTYLFMALIIIIVSQIINIFVKSQIFDLGITILAVVIFLGYIAYDIQKIKYYAQQNVFKSEDQLAICGALDLYLDFINLFIRLLQLFGNRKN